jgi:cell division protein FtsW
MKKLVTILILSVAILLLLGTVTLYSSTTYQPRLDRFCSHLWWIAFGSLACGLVSLIDYAWLRSFHLPKCLLGLACILLVAVLVPGIGVARNGAARWLFFGQPSEFAKLALIIFLADYGAARQSRMQERNAGFIYPGAIAGIIGLLIFLEPDWGTAALIAAVSLAMLAIAGTHWGYLFPATIIGAELFALLLLKNPLRMERLLAFRDPELAQAGIGWQGWHSLLSLGCGGWLGTFFGEGHHKNGFVPEQQTDFILSLLGEETGFLGTSLVLLLFVFILLCGARIAWRVSDPFGQLLASGLTVLIGLQAFINIAVVTSTLPNKGIALPFVSYGGSNLVCMLLCLGLLISVARHGPVLEQPELESQFAGHARPRISGPVGSLLNNSTEPAPKGLWQRLSRWLRTRRNARFPSVPSRPYQVPPRRTSSA